MSHTHVYNPVQLTPNVYESDKNCSVCGFETFMKPMRVMFLMPRAHKIFFAINRIDTRFDFNTLKVN